MWRSRSGSREPRGNALIELVVVFFGSLVAGYLGAAVGLVLGTLRLPILLLAAGSPAAGAGTNIAISAAAAAAGGLRHTREGRVDWRVVAWMAPPSIVGAIAGAIFADDAPERVLYAGVAGVLAWQGWDLLVRPFREHPRARPRYAPAVVFGLLIGALGGALGVILGTLRIPALLHAVGLPAARAVGTNLVVGFLLGAAGFAAHAAALNVEWDLLAAGLGGALPGAWLGAHLTGLASEQMLRRAIGAALLVIALAFALEAAFR